MAWRRVLDFAAGGSIPGGHRLPPETGQSSSWSLHYGREGPAEAVWRGGPPREGPERVEEGESWVWRDRVETPSAGVNVKGLFSPADPAKQLSFRKCDEQPQSREGQTPGRWSNRLPPQAPGPRKFIQF